MILLVLHNDENYLNKLLHKIQEEKHAKAMIHDTQGLGEELIGSRLDIFSGVRWTSIGDRFDHVLIVILKNQESLIKLKKIVAKEMDSQLCPGKGLLIALPYASIQRLKEHLSEIPNDLVAA